MLQVYAERFKELYAMLDGLPSTKVDLKGWRYDSTAKSDYIRRVSDKELLEECGTAACAVGWACAYPPFMAQGLHWSYNNYPIYRANAQETYSSWGAVEQFFGLGECMDEYLFLTTRECYPGSRGMPDEDVSRFVHIKDDRELVLARIRYHLLKTGEITQERYDELNQNAT